MWRVVEGPLCAVLAEIMHGGLQGAASCAMGKCSRTQFALRCTGRYCTHESSLTRRFSPSEPANRCERKRVRYKCNLLFACLCFSSI
jgi:hypothetical protein